MHDRVSLSGDTLVVADPLKNSYQGRLYVYERDNGGADNWGEIKKLDSSDSPSVIAFGGSVAIDGDTIVGGALVYAGTETNEGSAYVLDRDYGGTDNWGERKRLLSSSPTHLGNFGTSVAIDGDRIVVGEQRGESDKGAAYIFERHEGGTDNWGEVKRIVASDGATGDAFGFAVTIDGNYVAVIADGDDEDGTNTGSVYIFERNEGGTDNWGQVAKQDPDLTPILGSYSGGGYGHSLDIDGTVLVVGNIGLGNLGATHVYHRDEGGASNWGEVVRLQSPTGYGVNPTSFGVSVRVNGPRVLVGAHTDTHGGNETGIAWLFSRNFGGTDNYGALAKFVTSTGAQDDFIGGGVAFSGSTVVACASGDEPDTGKYGAAFVFDTSAIDECESDVLLGEITVGSGENEDIVSEGSIQNAGAYTVESGGDVTWTSETSITINAGFVAEVGGEFLAQVAPVTCS